MSNSNETFDMTRSAVPNTRYLQASIIAESESLSQTIELTHSSTKQGLKLRRFFQLGLPFAMCCMVIFVVVMNLSGLSGLKVDSNNALLVSEELDWQEVMLLEDEWLLADL